MSFASSQLGHYGWYNRCLAFVNAAWNYTVGRFRLATARASMNAGPRTMGGRPPTGAGVYWDTGPSGHIALAAGDGSVFSNDIRAAGRIDRVPQGEINKWGPYRGWWHPNGAKAGVGGIWRGRCSSGRIQQFDLVQSLIKTPLASWTTSPVRRSGRWPVASQAGRRHARQVKVFDSGVGLNPATTWPNGTGRREWLTAGGHAGPTIQQTNHFPATMSPEAAAEAAGGRLLAVLRAGGI
jgi:hypothetical protein